MCSLHPRAAASTQVALQLLQMQKSGRTQLPGLSICQDPQPRGLASAGAWGRVWPGEQSWVPGASLTLCPRTEPCTTDACGAPPASSPPGPLSPAGRFGGERCEFGGVHLGCAPVMCQVGAGVCGCAPLSLGVTTFLGPSASPCRGQRGRGWPQLLQTLSALTLPGCPGTPGAPVPKCFGTWGEAGAALSPLPAAPRPLHRVTARGG